MIRCHVAASVPDLGAHHTRVAGDPLAAALLRLPLPFLDERQERSSPSEMGRAF